MLKEAEAKGDRQGTGRPKNSDKMSPLPTLKEIGIEKKQSERWQQIADIPEPEFEPDPGGRPPKVNGKKSARR
jgi:hypothetical protein